MQRTHAAFWGAGWAGVFVGGLLTLGGMFGDHEMANLVGGYGVMLTGSAVYLLGGLGLRQTLARRSSVSEGRKPATTALPHGVSTANQP